MKLNIERLTEIRVKNGFSKLEASKILGLSQPAYLRYEAGERSPSVPVIREIARVMHTSVDYLVGATDNPSPDVLEVKKDVDEELFLVVETAVDFDLAQKKRLLKYTEKLRDQATK